MKADKLHLKKNKLHGIKDYILFFTPPYLICDKNIFGIDNFASELLKYFCDTGNPFKWKPHRAASDEVTDPQVLPMALCMSNNGEGRIRSRVYSPQFLKDLTVML